jgi:hypothetical protein
VHVIPRPHPQIDEQLPLGGEVMASRKK